MATAWPMRHLYFGRDVRRAVSIADLRAMALRRLPAFVSEYLEGGAEEEVTLAANRAAFDTQAFVPRALAGHDLGAGADLFGQTLSLPLIIAPTGL